MHPISQQKKYENGPAAKFSFEIVFSKLLYLNHSCLLVTIVQNEFIKICINTRTFFIYLHIPCYLSGPAFGGKGVVRDP